MPNLHLQIGCSVYAIETANPHFRQRLETRYHRFLKPSPPPDGIFPHDSLVQNGGDGTLRRRTSLRSLGGALAGSQTPPGTARDSAGAFSEYGTGATLDAEKTAIEGKIKISPTGWVVDATRGGEGRTVPFAHFHAELREGCSIRLTLSAQPSTDPWQEPILAWQPDRCLLTAAGVHGTIHLHNPSAEFTISPSRSLQEVEHLLRITCALWTFQQGGLLIHGAGLIRDGKGYLFTGHSGAGKTTICRVSQNTSILNDDLIILHPGHSGWEIWATPFSNPSQNEPNPGHAALSAILNLHQAKTHRVIPESPALALADLITHVPVVPAQPDQLGRVIERCKHILENIPAYRLHFLPDDEFWPLVPN